MIYIGVLKRRHLQVYQYLQRQSTDERSTFGSEYIAMKTAVEIIKALRYKLRTFGIEIDGPVDVFCDIESVTKILEIQSLPYQRNIMLLHIC